MTRIYDLKAADAKKHFLKGSSYFNGDFPNYISFEPLLATVSSVMGHKDYKDFKKKNPHDYEGVNYSFIANKDGRFAWRPYELMHPAIYVSLVNLICDEENWQEITARIQSFTVGEVINCGAPVISTDHQKDQAAQISNWWKSVEQQSLEYSLEFSHVLHTDVTDCYGSIYTHSIAWALHGMKKAKNEKSNNNLLGNRIDHLIRAGRYGQTNGISQGSVLMDFIAEIVLGYVDFCISLKLPESDNNDYRILRYRDDYRIFAHSDLRAEEILKVISDALRAVGMRLGVAKTFINTNVVEGSIKPDKLAGIELRDLGEANAKTIQKQLLRLHSFGRRFPNSGALKRLISELHEKIISDKTKTDDLIVQVAIATDIAMVSPQTFPAIAGILSHIISHASYEQKGELWDKVYHKMQKVPYNGYLEVWLQRVTKPKNVGIEYNSQEHLCRIVNGEKDVPLWNNDWISSKKLLQALNTSQIVIKDVQNVSEVVTPQEIELFTKNAEAY